MKLTDIKRDYDFRLIGEKELSTSFIVKSKSSSDRFVLKVFKENLVNKDMVKSAYDKWNLLCDKIEGDPDLNCLIALQRPKWVGDEFIARDFRTLGHTLDTYLTGEREAYEELVTALAQIRNQIEGLQDPELKLFIERNCLSPYTQAVFDGRRGVILVLEPSNLLDGIL